MTDQLSKEDLKQLENDLRILKEKYESEIEREKSQRDLQATRDSQQNKIFAENQVKQLEAKEKADKESQEKEKKEAEDLANFRKNVLSSLDTLNNKDDSESLKSLSSVDNKLSILIETLENKAEHEQVSNFADLAIIFLLFGVMPVYFIHKWLYKFLSDAVY